MGVKNRIAKVRQAFDLMNVPADDLKPLEAAVLLADIL